MGERKVINKYYPPDFDPALMPRGKKPKNGQYTVRMMMPMSVKCLTCGEYIYKGKKFNSKKETVEGEDYLGIKIFRFYMRCANCSAEFTIKTDPKNSDYVAELGVSRNFEPWRAQEQELEAARLERELEEKGDAMKALENRTLDSKLEMDIIEALDEIRALNARNSKLNPDQLLDFHSRLREQDQQAQSELGSEELDEMKAFAACSAASADFVRRLQPLDDDAAADQPEAKRVRHEPPNGNDAQPAKATPAALRKEPVSFLPISKRKEPEKATSVKVLPKLAVVKKAEPASLPSAPVSASAANTKPEPSALGLTGDYGSDSDGGEGGLSLVDY
eukprot:TRINITY_DN30805_c0_g1_i1.p1 TRINITY_DN30805_c0_g1~~TRINITY_DN30805_c0_g1_i1.p1  ORF type:complete len:333 (+),score=128.95 TRINITY_DN30805_c0_g1_i1:220-1218(+)